MCMWLNGPDLNSRYRRKSEKDHWSGTGSVFTFPSGRAMPGLIFYYECGKVAPIFKTEKSTNF